MFGIPSFSHYNPRILKFMQYFTLLGAGGFGLIHLFYPQALSLLLEAPTNTLMLGDMYIASVFLSFALMALLTLGSPDKYAPIAGFQGLYKTVWCVFFLANFFLGNIDLTLFTVIYFLIMLSYAIGDFLAFRR